MIYPISDYLDTLTFVLNKFPTEEKQESFKKLLADYVEKRLLTDEIGRDDKGF